MGIISLGNTNRLYWLGRYCERVYTTIRLFSASYDDMIDAPFAKYEEFCRRLDIPNIYGSDSDFIKKYCFSADDPNSIFSNLTRAYDNGITLREEIGSETLSYIQLAVYAMNQAKESPAPMIELQEVLDNLLAFWGMIDDSIDDENVRNIVKVGKHVERLDLYARLHMPREEMLREERRLANRVKRTKLSWKKDSLEDLNRLVMAEKIDYYKVVLKVENLLEV